MAMWRAVTNLILVAGISISAAPVVAQREAEMPVLRMGDTPAQVCAGLATLSFPFTPPQAADAAIEDARHARIAGDESRPVPAGARRVRIAVSGGMTGEGIGGPESLVAWQDAGGTWQVSRVYFATGRQPPMADYPLPPLWPEPPGTVEATTGPVLSNEVRDIWRGSLSPVAGAALDAMLAAPCMKLEPLSLPYSITVKGKGIAYCPSDSASWLIEIGDAEGSRLYSRACNLVGPVGAVVQQLFAAPLPKIEPPSLRYASYYAADPAPSVAKLQALLAAKLPGARLTAQEVPQGATITAYRQTAPCAGTLTLRGSDGTQSTAVRDWTTVNGFASWPNNGEAGYRLKAAGAVQDQTDTVVPGNFARAAKILGAIAGIEWLCRKDSAAP